MEETLSLVDLATSHFKVTWATLQAHPMPRANRKTLERLNRCWTASRLPLA